MEVPKIQEKIIEKPVERIEEQIIEVPRVSFRSLCLVQMLLDVGFDSKIFDFLS